jgi:hypothetical protein
MFQGTGLEGVLTGCFWMFLVRSNKMNGPRYSIIKHTRLTFGTQFITYSMVTIDLKDTTVDISWIRVFYFHTKEVSNHELREKEIQTSPDTHQDIQLASESYLFSVRGSDK